MLCGPAIPLSAPGDTSKDVYSSTVHACPRQKTIKCPKQNGKIVTNLYNSIRIQLEESYHIVMVDSEAGEGHNIAKIPRPA